MQVSPKYKRFKHSHIMGDTFTLPRGRSSIIRTIEGCNHYPNMAILGRLGKQTQIVEIDTPKTDRILSVYDRAYHPLPYTDMIILYYSSCGDISPDDMIVHQHGHTPIYIFRRDIVTGKQRVF